MQKIFKSNTALSLGILALGVAGLMVMVWLSPAPAPEAGSSAVPVFPAASEPLPVMAPAAVAAPGSDPFAERLRNPQTASALPASAAAAASAGSTIPAGVDPFKEKLIQQSRQATSSPFGAVPAKP